MQRGSIEWLLYSQQASAGKLHTICEVLRAREPASLTICTLLDKYERREVDMALECVGFHIPISS